MIDRRRTSETSKDTEFFGAAGTMTLAVMTRASLGHSGRQLAASLPTQLIYAAVLVAVSLALVPCSWCSNANYCR